MDGRVVVITGATGSLGPIAARRFAEAGASVVLVGTAINGARMPLYGWKPAGS